MAEVKRLIPDAGQRGVIDEMLHKDTKGGYLLASEQGAGKSLIVAQYIVEAQPDRTLLICPLGTRVGWERTLRGQGYGGRIVRIDSSAEGRKNFADYSDKVPGVYVIGREFFQISATTVEPRRKKDGTWTRGRPALWAWSKSTPDLAVYDEIHAAQNRKSLMHRVLKTLKAKYRIGMSGTPAGNKFQGTWAVCRWLWGSDIIDPSFHRWAAEHCVSYNDIFAGVIYEGEKVPGRFVSTLPGYARLMADLDVEMTEERRYVELSSAQRKAYTEMQMQMVAWLGENPMVAELPITMRIRLRQMTLGMPTINEDGSVGFADNCASTKIDALKEFISDLDDEPVLILTDSARFARVVSQRLGNRSVAWTGETSHSERERILTSFGTEDGPRYLVATIAAIGEGVDGLQLTCNTVVWLSRSENRILNEQAAKRLHRRGQTRPVRSVDIVAVDTYDDGVLNSQLAAALAMNSSLRKEPVSA